MKKRLFLLILGALSATTFVACAGLAKILAITDDKVINVYTQAPLERHYTAPGPHAVAAQKWDAQDKALKTFTVYYPQDPGPYPLVVMANGTGMPTMRYEPVLKHLASWGFVVIGNDEASSWSGQGASRALDFALAQSRTPGSPLHRKVDEGKIGVSGHSQGGVGAINLATTQPNSHLIRSVYTASITKLELAQGLKWPYDVTRVRVPYFMTAGTGAADAGNNREAHSGIAPLHSMRTNLERTGGPGLLARRQGMDHGELLYVANGYMTAWFLHTLNGDRQAAQVFTGPQAEIRRNANWQDVQVKNLR